MEKLCKNCGKTITTYLLKNSGLYGEPIHEDGMFSCDITQLEWYEEGMKYAEFPDEDNDS